MCARQRGAGGRWVDCKGEECVIMDDAGDGADARAEGCDGADATMHNNMLTDDEGSVMSDGDEESNDHGDDPRMSDDEWHMAMQGL